MRYKLGAVALWQGLEAMTQSQNRYIDYNLLANTLVIEFACGIIGLRGIWKDLRVFWFPAKLP